MKKTINLVVLQLFFTLSLFAQQQRALLIAIDHYEPPAGYKPSTTSRSHFPDLEGTRNDATAMYSLITSKFAFSKNNIDTLFNNSATRNGILKSFDDLLAKSSSGDIVLIYYAGHGSEVKNSKSFEDNQLDQTIVPCDTWKEGVQDIRDKELSEKFNAFLDKKVKLTCIFDCCHSGSISRGPNVSPGKLRFMPAANWDSKDPRKLPIPEEREGNNFLIYSAAQSDECASEQRDENGTPHGAFTYSLLESLNQLSVNASALSVFNTARAILKSNGFKQEPIIGGKPERQQQTLFGLKKGVLADYSFVAISKIMYKDGDKKKNPIKLVLQGGFALGLLKGNELSYFNDNDKKDTIFKLRVDSVLGIAQSYATIIKGDINNIKPGFQFRVTNWVSPDRPLLKIFVPKSTLSDAVINDFVNITKVLKASSKIKWVPKLEKGGNSPYISVFWVGDKCYVKDTTSLALEVKVKRADDILKFCKQDSTLYVEVPVSKTNAADYSNSLSSNKNFKLVNDITSSQYTLFGRLGLNGLPAYGLRKMQASVSDSLEAMPIETDCFEIPTAEINPSKNVGDSLNDRAMKLSKIRGWLNLSLPESGNAFCMHLEFVKGSLKKLITDGNYNIGDTINIRLAMNKYDENTELSQKYIYLFGIDQTGRMVLLFPRKGMGASDNKWPKSISDNIIPSKIIMGNTSPIGKPTGEDNYFLLACDEPITNAEQIFNQEGVSSNAVSRGYRGPDNPLTNLLDMGNAGTSTRGGISVPLSVSLQRYSFRCTYKK